MKQHEPAAQTARASLPWLFFCHGVRQVGDRVWQYFTPLFLSSACPNSMAPVALVTAAQSLAVLVLAPALARRLARITSTWSFGVWLAVENSAVICGALALRSFSLSVAQATDAPPMTVSRHPVVCSTPLHAPSFLLARLAFATDAVCSSTLGVIIERDWLGAVCASCRHSLAGANAVMARIDLGVAIAGPMALTAALAALAGNSNDSGSITMEAYARAVPLLTTWHVFAAVAVIASVVSILPAVGLDTGTRTGPSTTATLTGGTRPSAPGWRLWWSLRVPVQLVLVAGACLYFTVLSPSALLTAWLKGSGVTDASIARFRAALHASGALATFVAPRAARAGRESGALLRAAWRAQALQSCAVCMSCAFFYVASTRRDSSIAAWATYAFLGAIVVSRVGLWSFDLLARQLLQQEGAGLVLLSIERAMNAGSEIAMLVAGSLLRSTDEFGWLVAGSTAATVVSTVLLTLASSSSMPAARGKVEANKKA